METALVGLVMGCDQFVVTCSLIVHEEEKFGTHFAVNVLVNKKE